MAMGSFNPSLRLPCPEPLSQIKFYPKIAAKVISFQNCFSMQIFFLQKNGILRIVFPGAKAYKFSFESQLEFFANSFEKSFVFQNKKG